jgi:hypothetical protein
MESSKKRPLLWALFLFAIWVGVLVAAYWYFFIRTQAWFDPTMEQPPVLFSQQDQQALRQLLMQQFPNLKEGSAWFIRFRQPDCGCERFVELYHQSFVAQADASMQVVTLDLQAATLSTAMLQQLQKWVPATPSVAVFDRDATLNYFGPYHQDGICNADNSYLEPVLLSMREGNPISVLNTLVYGCFCPASVN